MQTLPHLDPAAEQLDYFAVIMEMIIWLPEVLEYTVVLLLQGTLEHDAAIANTVIRQALGMSIHSHIPALPSVSKIKAARVV